MRGCRWALGWKKSLSQSVNMREPAIIESFEHLYFFSERDQIHFLRLTGNWSIRQRILRSLLDNNTSSICLYFWTRHPQHTLGQLCLFHRYCSGSLVCLVWCQLHFNARLLQSYGSSHNCFRQQEWFVRVYFTWLTCSRVSLAGWTWFQLWAKLDMV